MHSYSIRTLTLAAVFCLAALPAYATKDVSSPTVSKGKLKFEARSGFEIDDTSVSRDNRFRQTYLFEYGVTDWWSTRLNLKFTHLDGGTYDYTAGEWENKIQLFFEKKDGFSAGFKVVYGITDDNGIPDTFEIKSMIEKNFGDFRARGNLGMLWLVEDNASRTATLNAALQGLVKVNADFSAGIEWFGEFGEVNNIPAFDMQDHLLGPVFTYKINDVWALEAGYLFGISDTASDGLFKFFVKGTF